MEAVAEIEAGNAECSLCLSIAQVIDGDETCRYCAEDAVLALANGADPEYELYCAKHGLDMIDSNAGLLHVMFDARSTKET